MDQIKTSPRLMGKPRLQQYALDVIVLSHNCVTDRLFHLPLPMNSKMYHYHSNHMVHREAVDQPNHLSQTIYHLCPFERMRSVHGRVWKSPYSQAWLDYF